MESILNKQQVGKWSPLEREREGERERERERVNFAFLRDISLISGRSVGRRPWIFLKESRSPLWSLLALPSPVTSLARGRPLRRAAFDTMFTDWRNVMKSNSPLCKGSNRCKLICIICIKKSQDGHSVLRHSQSGRPGRVDIGRPFIHKLFVRACSLPARLVPLNLRNAVTARTRDRSKHTLHVSMHD